MPSPKLPLKYVVSPVLKPTYRIRLKDMLLHRKKSKSQLTKVEIKHYRMRLRHIIGLYFECVCHDNVRPVRYELKNEGITATELNQIVKRIRTSAKNTHAKFAKPTKDNVWISRLKLSLQNTHPNILYSLYSHFENRPINFKAFLDHLYDYDAGCLTDENFEAELAALAKIEIPAFINSPRWANPKLAMLLYDLCPLWREVTGRPHYDSRPDSDEDRFYQWITRMFEKLPSNSYSADKIRSITASLKKIK